MKISVVGLGVEGQQATISLLKRGYDVYSSDINRHIDLSLCSKTPLSQMDGKLDLEIGSHNLDKIYKSDAVAVSPSLFNKQICKDIIERGIFISDIFTKHKDITTIAVTGTNGKTTTSHMIYNILKDEGYNAIIGGNGGGGFSGYIDLLMQANSEDYDYMIIEVCDMTLDFCSYVFDIDYVIVTNIGYDHMDVHGSIENYVAEVETFIESKPSILNINDENLRKIEKTDLIHYFDTYTHPLNLFGKFNLQNAHAASILCEMLNVKRENIVKSLENFQCVEGRTIKINYMGKEIVAGKTDNVDALKAVLEEEYFDTVFIGTPRKHEKCRYNILDYISSYKPENLIIFPGLEDTTYEYVQYLNDLKYTKDVLVLKNFDDIINYLTTQASKKVFIGGNGQAKITQLTKYLCENDENK